MEKTIRVHKVGTLTAGATLVLSGVLYLLWSVFGLLSAELITSLWPLILIALGVEILFSLKTGEKQPIDKMSVFLIIVMAFFGMGMAFLQQVINYSGCF